MGLNCSKWLEMLLLKIQVNFQIINIIDGECFEDSTTALK